jgi:XTP/dITP diphosphohydrolase
MEEGISITVEEGTTSMEENARQKAVSYARVSNVTTLADDSGLEVDALGGEPGIRSARYAGKMAGDIERVNYLLNRLEGIPWESRTARFKCAIAIAAPTGKVEICSGECEGLITFKARGNNGFGYDPIFYFPEYEKTMAELPIEIKNQISHRARAAQEACRILRYFENKAGL